MRLRRELQDTSDPFSMNEIVFRQYFRLSRAAVRTLLDSIFDELDRPSRGNKFPPHIQVLAALQFYGHGAYHKIVDLDQLMPMSRKSVLRCIRAVTNAIIKCLGHMIAFPSSNEQVQENKNEFLRKTDFPGCVGCVDGTHIGIISPPFDNQHSALLFYNTKGFHSINVQIVCDANFQILNINTRYAGSVQDSAIWQTSEVRRLMKQRFENGDQTTWLVGDQGFPLEPWLMTPVSVPDADSPEARYNLAFKKARALIDKCIGYLKMVFRCLHNRNSLHYSPKRAGKIVAACAILHNIRVSRNEHSEEDLDEDEYKETFCVLSDAVRQGQATRQSLIQSNFT